MLKVIGRGAYGKVTLVRKKDTGQVFAMKTLKKRHLSATDQVERTKSERKILVPEFREFQAIYGLGVPARR